MTQQIEETLDTARNNEALADRVGEAEAFAQ